MSCIEQRAYQSLGKPDLTLSHAGGGTSHTIWIVQIPFILGGSTFTHKCYVVDELSITVILGRDFLQASSLLKLTFLSKLLTLDRLST